MVWVLQPQKHYIYNPANISFISSGFDNVQQISHVCCTLRLLHHHSTLSSSTSKIRVAFGGIVYNSVKALA